MTKILHIKINGISGSVNVTHVGNVHIDRPDAIASKKKLVLDNVLYVPNLKINLISVKQLTEKGFEISFKNGFCTLKGKNQKSFIIKMNEEHIYALNAQQNIVKNTFTAEEEALLWEWHRRLGHPGSTRLLKVIRDLNILETKNNYQILEKLRSTACEYCMSGKAKRKPFKPRNTQSSRPLADIATDIVGPIKPMSFNKKRYFLTFIDIHSRYTWIFIIGRKSEAFKCFKFFHDQVTKRFGYPILRLHSDNGGEYTSKEFRGCLE